MDLEQTIKDLQAQNAQFQQMFLNLAKGKEELKVLVTSDRKKKAKKPISVLNMGRRFRGPVKKARDFNIPSDEDDKQDEDSKSVKTERSNPGSNKCPDEEEDDYLDKQYPSADEKYKLLEEILRAIEI